MKYLRHKEKGFLIPHTVAMETAEYEVIEELPVAPVEEPPARKKPGPKPKSETPESGE